MVSSLRSSKTSHKNSSCIQPECATGKKNIFKILQLSLEVEDPPASISVLLSLLCTFQNTCFLEAIYFNTTLVRKNKTSLQLKRVHHTPLLRHNENLEYCQQDLKKYVHPLMTPLENLL